MLRDADMKYSARGRGRSPEAGAAPTWAPQWSATRPPMEPSPLLSTQAPPHGVRSAFLVVVIFVVTVSVVLTLFVSGHHDGRRKKTMTATMATTKT